MAMRKMPKSQAALEIWKEIMSWKDESAPHHLTVRDRVTKRFAPTEANQDARAHEVWASLAERGQLQARLQNPPPALDFQGEDLESLLPDMFGDQDLESLLPSEDHVSSSLQRL